MAKYGKLQSTKVDGSKPPVEWGRVPWAFHSLANSLAVFCVQIMKNKSLPPVGEQRERKLLLDVENGDVLGTKATNLSIFATELRQLASAIHAQAAELSFLQQRTRVLRRKHQPASKTTKG